MVLEDRSGKVTGIEVKAAATVGSHDVRGLRALADEVLKNWVRSVVIYAGQQVISFSANLHAIAFGHIEPAVN